MVLFQDLELEPLNCMFLRHLFVGKPTLNKGVASFAGTGITRTTRWRGGSGIQWKTIKSFAVGQEPRTMSKKVAGGNALVAQSQHLLYLPFRESLAFCHCIQRAYRDFMFVWCHSHNWPSRVDKGCLLPAQWAPHRQKKGALRSSTGVLGSDLRAQQKSSTKTKPLSVAGKV